MSTTAGNGSMGHGSMGRMGHFFGRVTWVMGQCPLTHVPCRIFAYTVKLLSPYEKSKNSSLIEPETH